MLFQWQNKVSPAFVNDTFLKLDIKMTSGAEENPQLLWESSAPEVDGNTLWNMHKQIICMPRRVMQLCFDTRAQKQTKFLCLIWMSLTPMWNELKESYNPCCNVTFLSQCFLGESPPWERTWSAQHQSFSLRCDIFNAAPQNKQLRKRFPGSKSRHSTYFANHKLCQAWIAHWTHAVNQLLAITWVEFRLEYCHMLLV